MVIGTFTGPETQNQVIGFIGFGTGIHALDGRDFNNRRTQVDRFTIRYRRIGDTLLLFLLVCQVAHQTDEVAFLTDFMGTCFAIIFTKKFSRYS